MNLSPLPNPKHHANACIAVDFSPRDFWWILDVVLLDHMAPRYVATSNPVVMFSVGRGPKVLLPVRKALGPDTRYS
jgi:hypothetical protein